MPEDTIITDESIVIEVPVEAVPVEEATVEDVIPAEEVTE